MFPTKRDDADPSREDASSPGCTQSERAAREGTADAAMPSVRHGRTPADASSRPEPAGSTELRYRALRLHAKGGLGEVHLAEDSELHRQVALKRIQRSRADDAESRRRLLLEAEITARLEHPGVVPVHGLLHDQDGQPCYAMRFVQGETMQQAVARFHQDDKPGRNPGERSLALRELLSRFLAVCNTVAYAHSRGILHRDLKPANIMLGKYGETLLVDWGLAKAIRRDESARETGEETLAPATPGEDSATRTGEVVGTPAYMSPEQSAGRWDLVGPASDIYSLGATLYTLLTGEPPFQGPFRELQLPIQRGEFARPREWKKTIPPPLEAICLKAMALRPEDRYATAQDLAADLEHWLADEPVTAYRDSRLGKLVRWLRRHRGLAAGAAGLLIAAVVALAVGIVLINREKDLTNVAYAELQQEQERTADAFDKLQQEQQRTQHALTAEAHRRQQAREALNMLSSQVIDDWLARQQKLSPEQRKFLEKAAASYEQLAQDTGQEEASRSGVASAYFRIGHIWRILGQRPAAEQAFRRAIAVWEQLAADFPDTLEYRLQLAGTHINVGVLLKAMGRYPQAEEHYRRTLALHNQLVAKFPTEPNYRLQLAMSNNNLGNLLKETGRPKEAEQHFRTTLALYQQLAADYPKEARYRQYLAGSHKNLGHWLKEMAQWKAAEGEFRAGLALSERLAAEFPALSDYRLELATSHRGLGQLLKDADRPKEAEAEFREAIAILKQLAVDFPAAPGYRQELALNHNILGNLLASADRPSEAAEQHRTALALRKQLVTDFPSAPDYSSELATSHNNLAGVLHELPDKSRAQEAEEHYRAALAVRKRLVTDFPTVPKYRWELARVQNNLGFLLRDGNQLQEAEAHYREALSQLKQLGDGFPKGPDFHHQLASTLCNLAQLLRDRQEFGAARALVEDAARHLEAALAANPQQRNYRQSFRKSRVILTSILAGLGDHLGAGQVAEQLAAQGWDAAADRYKAACAWAQCLSVVENDAELPAAQRQELVQSYADRAVATLRQALRQGYSDLAHLKKDKDLDPVRSRPDFQGLLQELEMR